MQTISKMFRNLAAGISLLLLTFVLIPGGLAQETTGGLEGTLKDGTGAAPQIREGMFVKFTEKYVRKIGGNVSYRGRNKRRYKIRGGINCWWHWSRAYLRHLFMAKEMLGPILLSLHNIAFYQNLVRDMRLAVQEGRMAEFRTVRLAQWETAN